MSPARQDDLTSLTSRLAAVREGIAAAATRAGRSPAEITLVGVAKRHDADRVALAAAAGLTDVAENFAQEAREKIPQVNAMLAAQGIKAPRWHFIGRLQRNKARLVAPLFDCVACVDRAALADELDRRAQQMGRRLEVLVQVDSSREPQKGGVSPEAARDLLVHLQTLENLDVTGLMTVPAPADDPEQTRPAFALVRNLRDQLAGDLGTPLPVLSMGMSSDFQVAIEEGATQVRVGTAIFGRRPDAPPR